MNKIELTVEEKNRLLLNGIKIYLRQEVKNRLNLNDKSLIEKLTNECIDYLYDNYDNNKKLSDREIESAVQTGVNSYILNLHNHMNLKDA